MPPNSYTYVFCLTPQQLLSIIISAGQVLGVCMCDRHEERSSLQRWIGALQEKYPALSNATIIYDITETVTDDTQSIQQAQ